MYWHQNYKPIKEQVWILGSKYLTHDWNVIQLIPQLFFVAAVNMKLGELMELLDDIKANWWELAIQLDVNGRKIAQIISGNVCMDEMIKIWLETTIEKATIAAIIKALESPAIGNNRLADKIRKNPEIRRTYYGMNQWTVVKTHMCTVHVMLHPLLLYRWRNHGHNIKRTTCCLAKTRLVQVH